MHWRTDRPSSAVAAAEAAAVASACSWPTGEAESRLRLDIVEAGGVESKGTRAQRANLRGAQRDRRSCSERLSLRTSR